MRRDEAGMRAMYLSGHTCDSYAATSPALQLSKSKNSLIHALQVVADQGEEVRGTARLPFLR